MLLRQDRHDEKTGGPRYSVRAKNLLERRELQLLIGAYPLELRILMLQRLAFKRGSSGTPAPPNFCFQ